MSNQLVVSSVFQQYIDDPNTKLPLTLGRVLTAVPVELGKLSVVHPSDNDPVLISSKFGAVVIWMKF